MAEAWSRLGSPIEFTTRADSRGKPFVFPNRLWRLDLTEAFATVILSGIRSGQAPRGTYDLRDRHDRSRVYEIVLREGAESDLGVDGRGRHGPLHAGQGVVSDGTELVARRARGCSPTTRAWG